MKKLLSLFLCLNFLFFFCACKNESIPSEPQETAVAITDSLGNISYLTSDSRIAVCYGSFADCLQLSGKQPIAVTEDAVKEQGLTFPEEQSVTLLGSNKEINLESLIAAEPDYVILSADLSAQLKLEESLKLAGLKYGYFRVDTFDDYKAFMAQLCKLSGRDDLYKKNVTETEARIKAILAKIPTATEKTVLLMRAFSSGIKAKTDDNLAGMILKELGLSNIADRHPSLLEDLSVEQIIADNPDYIFVSTMGSEKSALEYLESNVVSNPAWSSLSAVKNGNYIVLPKELFHYKPNEQWDKAYEYLAKIIFPESFS